MDEQPIQRIYVSRDAEYWHYPEGWYYLRWPKDVEHELILSNCIRIAYQEEVDELLDL